MVSSKMAAFMLRRCAAAAVKFQCLSPSLSARRWLLSAAYTDTKVWEAREKDPQNLAILASTMDEAHDKNLPINPMTIAQFVDNISSREEVGQSEYYLYKFRHSLSGWYLHEWIVHNWIRQCLKYGARDKAMYTLKNKVQFGIFPDDFTFNLLIDSFIKDGDFKSACSVVEEVMLQETFYLSSTQILSLYALSSYLATRPQLTVSEERAIGASLLISGLKQNVTICLSTQLLGNAFLGKVEILKGINAVFKGMPLSWERGYLGRALAVMAYVADGPADFKLTKDTLEYVNDLLQELSLTSESDSSGEESGGEEDKKEETVDEDDRAEAAKLPEYVRRFKELSSQLESQGKVESASFQRLVTTLAQQKLADEEQRDLKHYEGRIEAWDAEKRLHGEGDEREDWL